MSSKRELIVALKGRRQELGRELMGLDTQLSEAGWPEHRELIAMQIDATRLLLNIVNTRIKAYEQ